MAKPLGSILALWVCYGRLWLCQIPPSANMCWCWCLDRPWSGSPLHRSTTWRNLTRNSALHWDQGFSWKSNIDIHLILNQNNNILHIYIYKGNCGEYGQYQASKWAGGIESGSTVQDSVLKSVNPSSCAGRGQLVKSETKDRPWWATAQACQKRALQQANQLLVLKLHFFAKKVHDTVQVVSKLQNNPFLLILNVPLILKTGIHLQFPKISVWPIWLLIDPL